MTAPKPEPQNEAKADAFIAAARGLLAGGGPWNISEIERRSKVKRQIYYRNERVRAEVDALAEEFDARSVAGASSASEMTIASARAVIAGQATELEESDRLNKVLIARLLKHEGEEQLKADFSGAKHESLFIVEPTGAPIVDELQHRIMALEEELEDAEEEIQTERAKIRELEADQ